MTGAFKLPKPKIKITADNRHKELIQFKLRGERIVALDQELKAIYRIKN